MCEICQRDEVMEGQKLCAVCDEAILRLANAVSAIQTQVARELPASAADKRNAEEFRAVLFSDWR